MLCREVYSRKIITYKTYRNVFEHFKCIGERVRLKTYLTKNQLARSDNLSTLLPIRAEPFKVNANRERIVPTRVIYNRN